MATGVMVWSFCFGAMFNTDLWFHLAAGRLIVEQRGVPRMDSWSFAAPRLSWQNHEWLTDVLLHVWERTLGIESLTYWMWASLLATFLLLFAVLRRLSGSDAFSFLATSLCAALSSPFFEIRPNLLTQLLFVAIVPLALIRRRPWWGLPIVIALWINLHGGGVFGLMAIGVALAARTVERKPVSPGVAPPPRPAALLSLFGVCVAAALVNPFGSSALTFPIWLSLFSRSVSRRFLGEWQSPWVEGGIRAPLFPLGIGLAALALLILAGRLRRREGLTLGLAGLTALTLFMSLQSRRFIPLFALALGPWLAHAWAALRGSRRVGRRSRAGIGNFRLLTQWSYAAAVLALAAGCLRLSLYPLQPQIFNALVKLDWMPVESLNFIEANGIAGNVFADFEWAGYVQYRTAGRMKVFADPRWETVYPDAIQMRYLQVLSMQGDWLEIIEESGAQYVLWPPDEHDGRVVLDGLLRTGRWRHLYEDRRSVLLVRTDAIPAAARQPTQPSSFRTWALAHQAQKTRQFVAAERWLIEAREQQPVLVEICRDLAILQARRGDEMAMRATADRCDRIFPDPPEWRTRLQTYLGSHRSSAALGMP
jgi:hypothetical protein